MNDINQRHTRQLSSIQTPQVRKQTSSILMPLTSQHDIFDTPQHQACSLVVLPDQESSHSEEAIFYEECDDDDFVRVEHVSVVSGIVSRNSMINGIQRLFGLRGLIYDRCIDDGNSDGCL